MKKLLLLSLFTIASYSQGVKTSVNITTDYMVVQKGKFYGGIELDAKFSNSIYIRPQIHYADLIGINYLETSSGIGIHLPLNRFETSNIYGGVKLGFMHRERLFPLFGVECGVEVPLSNVISIGIRGSYDIRNDIDKWTYNSQGYVKFNLN